MPTRRSRVSPALQARIRVGPAGWSYTDWKGLVYPVPAPRGFDPLQYLVGYFDAIEINSSFYGPPSRAVAGQWVERVREYERFKFTAKLWRRFTHERREAFIRSDVAEAASAFSVLHAAGRLGAVLLQFPWSFRRTDENREWLDDVLRAFGVFPLVVEVRHASWNIPEFCEELTARKVGFVNIDQPLFKRSIKPSAAATAPVGYIRVHGRNYKHWFRKGRESTLAMTISILPVSYGRGSSGPRRWPRRLGKLSSC